MLKISKQKIYDSLLVMKSKDPSLRNICVYATFTPYQGIRLHYRLDAYIKRTCWMKDTLELTECLNHHSVFEMAEEIALKLELWIKRNNFQYDQ